MFAKLRQQRADMIVALAIIGFLLYYVFVFVKARESVLKQESFRTLNVANENANELLINYRDNARSGYVKLYEEYRDSLKRKAAAWKKDIGKKEDKVGIDKSKKGAIALEVANFNIQQTYINRIQSKGLANPDIAFVASNVSAPVPGGGEAKKTEVAETETKLSGKADNKSATRTDSSNSTLNVGKYSLIKKGTAVSDFTIIGNSIQWQDTITLDGSMYSYQSAVKLEDIVNKFLDRGTVFSDYIILDSCKTIVYESINTGITKKRADTLLLGNRVTAQGNTNEITLSGGEYKVFVMPAMTGQHPNWVICGLMPLSSYKSKCMSLSGHAMLILILVLVLLLLAFPVLKVVLLSPGERLSVQDLFALLIAFYISTAIITLGLLSGGRYLYVDNKDIDTSVELLANSVENNLTGELKDIYKELDDLRKDKGLKVYDDSLLVNNPQYMYPYFVNLFWINNNGNIAARIPTRGALSRANVGQRQYFTNIKDHKGWLLNNQDTFMLQSIRSLNNGQIQAAVCIPFNSQLNVFTKNTQGKTDTTLTRSKPVALALSTKLNSVIDPIVPVGMGFCIIDEQGKVLFHSEKRKNLQENFVEECTNREDIKGVLFSKNAACFSTSYSGKYYRMYAKPLSGLPLSVVGFYDTSYYKAFHFNVLGFTIVYMSLFILWVAIFLLLKAWACSSKPRYGVYHTNYTWLWPRQSYGNSYIKTMLLNFSTLLVGYLFIKIYGYSLFMIIAFMIIVVPLIKLIDMSIILFRDYKAQFSVRRVEKYIALQCIRNNRYRRIFLINVSSLLALNVIFGAVIRNMTGFWMLPWFGLIAFQFIILVIAFVLISNHPIANYLVEQVNDIIKQFDSKSLVGNKKYEKTQSQCGEHIRTKYALRIFSFITLFVIAPIHVIYKKAYDNEMVYWVRYNQVHVANSYKERDARIIDEYKNYKLLPDEKNGAGITKRRILDEKDIYTSALFNTIIKREGVCDTVGKWEWTSILSTGVLPDSAYYVLSNVCITNDSLRTQSRSLSHGNTRYIFSKPHLPFRANSAPACFQYGEQGKGSLTVTSTMPIYSIWQTVMSFNGFVYVPVGLVVFFLLYKLLLLGIRRSFVLRLSSSDDTDFIEIEKIFARKDGLSRNLFIQTLPYTDNTVSASIKQRLKTITCDVIDIRNIEKAPYIKTPAGNIDVSAFNAEVILLEHFECEGLSQEGESYKIKLLKALLEKDGVHILLISAIPVLDLVNKLSLVAPKNELFNIFSNFQVLPVNKDLLAIKKAALPVDLPYWLKKELESKPFLQRISDTIIAEYSIKKLKHNQEPELKENVLLKIQQLCSTYYQAIWNASSAQERYLLFDLACDGIINPKNIEVLEQLLQKGLLSNEDGRIRIINESFRYFILGNVDDTERKEFEEKVNETAIWQRFRFPIIILSIGIMLFLITTQHEFLNKMVAYATAAGAALTVVLKLIAQIPTSKQSGEAK